jgi:hypothetical protein
MAMNVAIGFKSHSGWACFVVVGREGRSHAIVERGRIELVDAGNDWGKAPYHAAEGREPKVAERIVADGIAKAHRVARREVGDLARRVREAHHHIAGCGVIAGAPLPDWTVEQILAVHVRMHLAEGFLFPHALEDAVTACELSLTRVPKKEAESEAGTDRIVSLGKGLGPPWGKDQKCAAAAAIRVLATHA